jgi:predicted amidophosphoribosyltransferase
MANHSCARCGTANDDGAKYCEGCGASLAELVHCPTCSAMNPLGRKFCTRCGGSLELAGWGEAAQPGAIVDGVWERGGDELIRRVDPDEARRFLGTRTVRVPAGTVGVVLVDGVVDRVLAPGERTSVTLFERVASFFTGRERTAFYLVDQRPFPVPYVVRTRPSAAGEVVKTQVLVTFLLPKGDRAALAQFIANVVGARPSVSTGDLYNRLRPEVVRIAQHVIERQAAAGEVSYPDAEAEIRRQLEAAIAARDGLTVDVTLAPLTTLASIDLQLGIGEAPKLRVCASCRAELPVSLRFCDRCGAKQPVEVVGGAGADEQTPLFTVDGQQVELDLVVRAQGQHDDFTPGKIAPAVVAAVAAQLRDVAFATLASAAGMRALEAALAPAVTDALTSLGMTLVALAVIDVRSKTGQWVLAARADLERAAEDVRLGLSWLEQRDNELDLEQLTIARVLRSEQQRRDQRFAEDQAAVGDRERRDALAARGATVDVAQIQRTAAVAATRDAVELARQKTLLEAELATSRARRDADFAELERRKRLELELSAIAERQQLDKLRGMATLDRELATQDQAHVMERRAQLAGLTPDQMIAMQAAELAKGAGGGAAWANALAATGAERLETERKHAEDQRAVYDRAMAAMAQVAASRAEAAPVVAAPVVQVGAGAAAGAGPACEACGAAMKPGARFCGACGVAPKAV